MQIKIICLQMFYLSQNSKTKKLSSIELSKELSSKQIIYCVKLILLHRIMKWAEMF